MQRVAESLKFAIKDMCKLNTNILKYVSDLWIIHKVM